MATSQKNILIDTCVLLDDPNVISRIRTKGGLPFLTSTVLDEIDFKKKGNESTNRNARAIFRELNKEPTAKLDRMPTGQDLISGDILTRFGFDGGPVFLIGRDEFKSRSNNDGKIIELAKHYGMLLLTRDNGMKVRAAAMGVTAVLWKGPPLSGGDAGKSGGPSSQRRGSERTTKPAVPPFSLPSSPTTERDHLTPVSYLPKERDKVIIGSGQVLQLGSAISAGGEGRIYQTTDDAQVCKIYHADKLTLLRRKKIELMVSRKIQRAGICWPVDIVMNDRGEFVGYIMPRAKGRTLQASTFVKPVLEKTFPNWGRLDLVNLCLAFIDHMRFLHSVNIIVGDINPMNLLVTEDSTHLWMVDTDSFQIENYPCPVGTVNFTAPEIQGRNYAEFLRTKDHELFAVSTMLFMLLHPGKPPYSQQGGGSPTDNIKAMDFPYRFRKNDDEYGGKNAPHGPWQLIWSNLPYHMKEHFHWSFRENRRLSIDEWQRALRKYHYMLSKGTTSAEMFPTSFRVRDPVNVPCGKCGSMYTASQQWVDKLMQQGKQPWCPECINRFKLERLARDSARDAHQAVQQNSGKKPTGGAQSRPSSTPPYRPTGNRGSQGRKPGNHTSNPKPATGLDLVSTILKFIFK